MITKIGGILFGLGLVIGFFGTLTFRIVALYKLRKHPEQKEILHAQFNKLLIVVIGLVSVGGGLMVLGKVLGYV